MRRLILCVFLAVPLTACFRAAPSAVVIDSPVDAGIAQEFGPEGPGVVACMLAVADRESRDDPGARNGSGASGVFQIVLPLHNDLFYAVGGHPYDWPNPAWNILVAHALWRSSGIAPWEHC